MVNGHWMGLEGLDKRGLRETTERFFSCYGFLVFVLGSVLFLSGIACWVWLGTITGILFLVVEWS